MAAPAAAGDNGSAWWHAGVTHTASPWGGEPIWAGEAICSPTERGAKLGSRAPVPKMAQGRAAFAAWETPAPQRWTKGCIREAFVVSSTVATTGCSHPEDTGTRQDRSCGRGCLSPLPGWAAGKGGYHRSRWEGRRVLCTSSPHTRSLTPVASGKSRRALRPAE